MTGRRSGRCWPGRPIVADNRDRTWAVVARITHPGIGLAETAARARMGAGLADLLEAAATADLVSLVALQVRTVPDDGAERAAWQRAHLRPDAPALARAVNAELGAVMTQAGVRHEAFVTVVVPESRIAQTSQGGRRRRRRPGPGPVRGDGRDRGPAARPARLHQRHLARLARVGGGDPHRLRPR